MRPCISVNNNHKIKVLKPVEEELRRLQEKLDEMKDLEKTRCSRKRVSLKYREKSDELSSDDETIHDSDWYTSFHKIRRHSDLEMLESEKQATKQRITMAVSGETISDQPVYDRQKQSAPKAGWQLVLPGVPIWLWNGTSQTHELNR